MLARWRRGIDWLVDPRCMFSLIPCGVLTVSHVVACMGNSVGFRHFSILLCEHEDDHEPRTVRSVVCATISNIYTKQSINQTIKSPYSRNARREASLLLSLRVGTIARVGGG